MGFCRHSLNFAHVPVVYAGHLPIVPGDCDCIPTCFGDNAAVSGVASPIYAVALLEAFGFADCHRCSLRCLRSRTVRRAAYRCLPFSLRKQSCFTSAAERAHLALLGGCGFWSFLVGSFHEFVGWFLGRVPLDHLPSANITIDAAAVSNGQFGIAHDVLRRAVPTDKVIAIGGCWGAHRGIICAWAGLGTTIFLRGLPPCASHAATQV